MFLYEFSIYLDELKILSCGIHGAEKKIKQLGIGILFLAHEVMMKN